MVVDVFRTKAAATLTSLILGLGASSFFSCADQVRFEEKEIQETPFSPTSPLLYQEKDVFNIEKDVTNSNGQAYVQELEVLVQNNLNQPIFGVEVYGVTDSWQEYVLAVDSSGAYFPKLLILDQKADNIDTRSAALSGPVSLILDTANTSYKMLSTSPGEFIGDSDQVNKYCMTPEQVKDDVMNLPSGLLFFAGKFLGVGSEVLEIAVATPLEELFEKYIKSKYGEHEGYEVWVPKTAMSVCNKKGNNALCEVSDLSEIFSSNIPVWKIHGECTPSSTFSSPHFSNEAQKSQGRFETQGDGTILDTQTGSYWQQTPSWCDNCTTQDIFEYCIAPWRVPTEQELLEIRVLGDGYNLLAEVFEGNPIAAYFSITPCEEWGGGKVGVFFYEGYPDSFCMPNISGEKIVRCVK